MQLNPARGRKHIVYSPRIPFSSSVYAAQPREGTETLFVDDGSSDETLGVYAAQPREGTETRSMRR